MKKYFLRRALSGASLAAVTLGSTLFLVAGPAQALTCVHSISHAITNSTGVSHATFTISYGCSDKKIHMSGTIYDDKCDSRAGQIDFYGGFVPGFADPDWTYTGKAGNGCHTHSTFSGSKLNPVVPSITVNVYACNSTSCADDQLATYDI
jgi:hypothetical protein